VIGLKKNDVFEELVGIVVSTHIDTGPWIIVISSKFDISGLGKV
jgi:hypothetical protein